MKVTLIGYEEAAHILKAGESTVRRAVSKGNLTKVEISGKVQHVIEEQVRLFENESQIRKSLLKDDRLAVWENYKTIAENYTAYKRQDIHGNTLSAKFQTPTLTSPLDPFIMNEEDYNGIMRTLDVLERIEQLSNSNAEEDLKKSTSLLPRNESELAKRIEQLSEQIVKNAKDENFTKVVDFIEQVYEQGEGIPIFPTSALAILPYIRAFILRNLAKQKEQLPIEAETVEIK